MQNTELENTSEPVHFPKKPFFKTQMPLVIGAVILTLGSLGLGYSLGHRQGLTVVGYDADAEQLVDVVQKQKQALNLVNKSLNIAVQERDVAVTNANNLYQALEQTRIDKTQLDSLSQVYREVLRQRGGVSLMVQNFGIKPLPENAYEYQLDLLQVSPSRRRAAGTVELRLIRGTEVLVIPMQDNQFDFDEFERLTGRWTMPKDFVPQFIEVRLTGAVSVTKRFSWQRGKPVDNSSAFVSEIPQAEAKAQ